MTEVLGDFIRALRANDVRISAAEAIDAARALDVIGYDRRDLLRHALGNALAKTGYEKDRFGETFDQFFTFRTQNEPDQVDQEEPDDGPQGESKSLTDMLLADDQVGMDMAMAEAARQVRLNDIVFFTQRGLYTMRIL